MLLYGGNHATKGKNHKTRHNKYGNRNGETKGN